MSSLLLPYALGFGMVVLVFIGVVSAIRRLIVARRLHLLSLEVVAHGSDTFQHVHVMTCEACHSKRHVHVYSYGLDTAMKTVALCSLCVPRLERSLERVSPVSSPSHARTSSQGGRHER